MMRLDFAGQVKETLKSPDPVERNQVAEQALDVYKLVAGWRDLIGEELRGFEGSQELCGLLERSVADGTVTSPLVTEWVNAKGGVPTGNKPESGADNNAASGNRYTLT